MLLTGFLAENRQRVVVVPRRDDPVAQVAIRLRSAAFPVPVSPALAVPVLAPVVRAVPVAQVSPEGAVLLAAEALPAAGSATRLEFPVGSIRVPDNAGI